MIPRRATALAILIFLAAIGAPVPRAEADPFGWELGGPQLLADSRDHWFCTTSSIPSQHRTHYQSSMAYLDNRTDMYDVDAGSTCGPQTDVVFMIENNLTDSAGRPALGKSVCAGPVSPGSLLCESAWVLVNEAHFWQLVASCGGDLTANYLHVIRHEIGHTTGLAHGPRPGHCGPPYNGDDAMNNDWITTGTLSLLAYNTHHKSHVDGFY